MAGILSGVVVVILLLAAAAVGAVLLMVVLSRRHKSKCQMSECFCQCFSPFSECLTN